jgi:5'-methylthioadenosine phosphorylase
MSDIRIGLIGGTGLGEALGAEKGERHEIDTPFGSPSSAVITTTWQGVDIAILQRHGPGHRYGPSQVPYRANIFALKKLGITHIVASGACGSLREQIEPRDLVIADQVIDKTHKRASTFYERAAVHVELSEPFCPVMRRWLIDTKRRADRDKRATKIDAVGVHDTGAYVCMEGPQFSSRAESEMHRSWGGDLIGMTCMPEAKLAREAEIAYALIALATDYDCWRPHDPHIGQQQLLEEIIGHLKAATANSIELIKQALQDLTILEENPSPAHEALKLAIWTNKSLIPVDEVDRLAPLWGRYFEDVEAER